MPRGVVPLWCPLRLLAGPRQHQGVRGAPGGSPGPLGPGFGLFQSLCRHATQSPNLSVQNGLLETFRGICPPRHPGRLSGPPELPPGALGSCRQRFFPGLHVPAETFLFPYAGFVGLKVCTELPDSFFRMKGYAGAGPGLIQGDRVAVEPSVKPPAKPPGNHQETAVEPPAKPRSNRRRTWAKPPGKPPENCRKSPVFGSLLPVSIRTGQGLSDVIFRPLGGVAIGGSFPGVTDVLSGPMGLAERGFAGF